MLKNSSENTANTKKGDNVEQNDKFSYKLFENIKLIKGLFSGDCILRVRKINFASSSACIFYFDGMVNVELINESIVKPLIRCKKLPEKHPSAEYVCENILYASEIKMTSVVAEAVSSMMYGDTLLILENSHIALTINTKGWRTRGISEPENERILEGPREGFDEAAMFNLALIRRRLQTTDFCTEFVRVGRRTNTTVFICYLKSLVNRETLRELKFRLSKIDIDSVLDSNYIVEQISDRKNSIFKTAGTTERPDIVAARLLEGRIALVVDSTPMVMTLPYLFSENFQSDEDYYINYLMASAGRLIRLVSFFLAVAVTGIYIALTTFHFELLPSAFAGSVSAARESVPFPTVAEAIIMTVIFEILRETGIRMSQSVGHALSIVGGLVVGQAAVEAKIVSAPMLIVVALSGICGLMVPRLRTAVFYLRFAMILAASFFGLYGILFLSAVVLIYILNLSSFGVDATLSLSEPAPSKLKDVFIRIGWDKMRTRPMLQKNNLIRKK